MIEDFLRDATQRMDKSVETTHDHFNSVRTGRAAPALLDEVVRLGREHQVEVGSLLGQQVPGAIERLLEGALSHPANQPGLAPFLTGPATRRETSGQHLPGNADRIAFSVGDGSQVGEAHPPVGGSLAVLQR